MLLLPLSCVYWLGVVLRNWFFDMGVFHVVRLEVPVVSVGNIAAGGTGKTPFVEFIVNKLKSMGHKPGIVSRGYGRDGTGYRLVSDGKSLSVNARQGGDEPVLLAQHLPGTPVAVGANRVEASQRMLEECDADCIVMDDGFQHRALHRDVDFVLLSASDLFGRRWLLPAGNRRETLVSLRRADMAVISKCRSDAEYREATQSLTGVASTKISGFQYEPCSLCRMPSGAAIERPRGDTLRVVIAAGIGDFESFRAIVRQSGCQVLREVEFRDHAWYSGLDLDALKDLVDREKAEYLVTTEKDIVRMQTLGDAYAEFLREVPLAVLKLRLRMVAGEERVDELLERAFA